MKALDDLTLEITLERPLNSFDRTIAVRGLYPLRQDFVEQVGSQQLGSSPETMLFSGPVHHHRLGAGELHGAEKE